MRAVAVVLVLLLDLVLAADPPKLTALHPAGIAIGAEAIVDAMGSSTWPVKAWCSSPAVKIEPLPEKGKLKIKATPDASPGPILIRLYNEAGASDARIFVLGSAPELLEVPKNDRPEDAHAVASLPVTINGILEKRGDVDFFRVSLKRGQTLHARLEAYSLRTEIDPYLHLIAPDGRELALASDAHNLDPVLVATVPANGAYLIQLSAIAHKATAEVAFAGAADRVYRLSLQTTPIPHVLPKSDSVEGPAPQTIKAPHRLQGTVAKAGEKDRYRVEAAAGSKLRVRVEARTLHLPMDPVLRIYKAEGALLRETDDSNAKPDPFFDVTVEAAGFFEAEVRDRFRRPEMTYQLVIEPIVPAYKATATPDALVLTAGKTAELTLNLSREDGHSAALELLFSDLPAGITWKAEAIPAKTGPFKVTLSAPPTAPAFSGPIHLSLKEPGPAPAKPIVRTWQTEESRGDYLINETADFWLTVIAVPVPPSPAPAPPAVPTP